MTFENSLASIIDNVFDAQPVANSGMAMGNSAEPKQLERQMKQAQLHLDTKERQQRYVAEQKANGGGMGVVFQEAFIRGMRDLGYKDPSWAIAELIDNAVQADCHTVDIRFGFAKENASQAKNPSEIAIIDDGNGMLPDMIGYAVRWGGTDRLGDRNGFGRFGYGLPSACVSIACRYTVYSRIVGGDWHAVTIDIEKLAAASNDPGATERLLTAKKCALPKWLLSDLAGSASVDVEALRSGTVIVLEDLDRLREMGGWKQVKTLKDRLLKQYGLIYRHWIPEISIFVAGAKVDAVDPLFLMPHARFYDETTVLAKKVPDIVFEVEAKNGSKGTVRIRAALLPPKFSWASPEDASSGAKKNQRWSQVLAPKEQLIGLIICREGRQIDVVQPDWTKFQNNDAYIKIEVDFDPVLDEFFNITTSKQQIRIHDSMWDKLRDSGHNAGGLRALVQEMRAEFDLMGKAVDAEVKRAAADTTTPLPAATAMAEAERFKSKTPRLSPEAKAEALKNLEQEVDTKVRESGQPREEVRAKIVEAAAKRPWDIDFAAIDEGPFYIPKRLGTQKRIVLNTAHPFYSRLYAKASPDVSAALDVLMFVLADGEIDAEGDRAQFYKSERNNWSVLLQHALSVLVTQSAMEDQYSSKIEKDELQTSV